MIMDLTEIIDTYAARFKTAYAAKVTRSQLNAMNAVLDCRTARYGKMLLNCTPCHLQQSRFQSCGHRSCHRCQNIDTSRWLERQRLKLLPVEYFMVTFTLPYELRALTWHHQKQLYSFLFQSPVCQPEPIH